MSEQTVSQWRSGRQTPEGENLDGLAKLLGISKSEILYGRVQVREPDSGYGSAEGPAIPLGLPQAARVWLQRFLLEIAEAGASDREIESARRLLAGPESFAFYYGGPDIEPPTEEQLLKEMEAISIAIRTVLKHRGRNIK